MVTGIIASLNSIRMEDIYRNGVKRDLGRAKSMCPILSSLIAGEESSLVTAPMNAFRSLTKKGNI